MRLETVIGLADQPLVKSLFADPGFIPRNEQDCLALRVEGEGYSPFAISRTEPQFLHVRVARAVQRVNPRPPQWRPELLHKARQHQNLRLHVLVQIVELRLKFVANLNNPAHLYNMTATTYDVNIIPSGCFGFCCGRFVDRPGGPGGQSTGAGRHSPPPAGPETTAGGGLRRG